MLGALGYEVSTAEAERNDGRGHRRPVGSGKSTVARRVAERLGYLYLDTGAMYRAVGLLATEAGVALDDEAAVVPSARPPGCASTATAACSPATAT